MDKMYAVYDWVMANRVKVAVGALVIFVLLGWSFGYVPEWPE